MIPWSQIKEYREQIHQRYPSIWSLKLIKRPSRLIKELVSPGMHVLDVGAGDRRLEKRIKGFCQDVVYKSMDVDRGFPHDYYSLDEIKEQFDLILLLEVLEHLKLEEGLGMLDRLKDLMKDGGRLIISIPNSFHPNEYWRNVDHKTLYSYEDLGAILLSKGFEVKGIYRAYNAPFIRLYLRLYFLSLLHKILSIDFAKSIVFLAEKG